MKTSKIGVLTATVVCAAAFVGPAAGTAWAAPASHVRPNFQVSETGYGATLSAADHDARTQLHGDYYGCGTIYVDSYQQLSDGTWTETISSNCAGYN